MLILFLVGGLVLVGISLFVLFDCLLYLEYEDHRHAWEKDDRPAGFFWRPSGVSFWRGSLSRSSLASSWLFNTPQWVLADPKARRLLFSYRLLWWISIIGWLVTVIDMIAKGSES
jgi:hypothetical protein